MELSKASVMIFSALIALTMISQSAYGQVPTVSCSASMLSSFTPCLNFLSNSSANGTAPTSDCCSSLKGVMSNGTDCFCQIATGAIPFRIPINRTVVMSLPKACKMGGVPLQCKSTAAPVPAPGPIAFSPVAQSPSNAAAAPSPFGSTTPPNAGSPEAQGPGSDTTPSGTSLPPTSTSTGGSSSLNPTASDASRSFPASLLTVSLAAAMIFKHYC